MMRTTFKLLKPLAVLSALLSLCTSGLAQQIVYDNSLGDLNRIVPATNSVEYGDEITLDPTTSNRIVTDFKFEYFLSQNANHNETITLRLYKNDGAPVVSTGSGGSISLASPGTLLYEKTSGGVDSPLTTGFATAEASLFAVTVPDTLTWTVTFGGLDSGEVAGLRVYDPPTVGSSFADFWTKSGGTWSTAILEDGTPANFAARVIAVPEPTTLAYALLAGLTCLGYLGYKRRS